MNISYSSPLRELMFSLYRIIPETNETGDTEYKLEDLDYSFPTIYRNKPLTDNHIYRTIRNFLLPSSKYMGLPPRKKMVITRSADEANIDIGFITKEFTGGQPMFALRARPVRQPEFFNPEGDLKELARA